MKRLHPCHYNKNGLLVAGCYESAAYGPHSCTCDNAAFKRCDEILERIEKLEKLVAKMRNGANDGRIHDRKV